MGLLGELNRVFKSVSTFSSACPILSVQYMGGIFHILQRLMRNSGFPLFVYFGNKCVYYHLPET